jgi:hydrogenase maturation protease
VLLEAGHRVVLVDAVAGGGPPGTVMQLDPDALVDGPTPLSSHGIGIAEAIALARTLYSDAAVARLAIVGVAIERPAAHAIGLSPAVAAAVGPAAVLVAGLAGDR